MDKTNEIVKICRRIAELEETLGCEERDDMWEIDDLVHELWDLEVKLAEIKIEDKKERVPYKLANVKFNNGNGALLCNGCRFILAYGFDHEDKEHFCEVCKPTPGRPLENIDEIDSLAELIDTIEKKHGKCKHKNIIDGRKKSTIKYSKCIDCGETIRYTDD